MSLKNISSKQDPLKELFKKLSESLSAVPAEEVEGSLAVVISGQEIWAFTVSNFEILMTCLPLNEFNKKDYDTIVKIKPPVLSDMFGKKLACIDFVDECLNDGSIKLIKGKDLEVFEYLFIEMPTDEIFKAIEEEENFDGIYGVDTMGIEDTYDEGSESEKKHNTRYVPTPASIVFQAIDCLDIDYSEYNFVDAGCGKGRALLISNRYPFKKVTGIEYDDRLATLAADNLNRFPSEKSKALETEIVNQDAKMFNPAAENTVFFLYEPFSKKIFKKFLKNIYSSIYSNSQKVIFLMVGQGLLQPLNKASWLELKGSYGPSSLAGPTVKSGWLISSDTLHKGVGDGNLDLNIYSSISKL